MALFLATWNPWWVPTGDSEVYLVTARNLVRGDGLTFLGHRVAFVPPGWSMVLAGLLWLGASIAQLKLLQIAFMTGGLLLCYGILRQLPAVPRHEAPIAPGSRADAHLPHAGAEAPDKPENRQVSTSSTSTSPTSPVSPTSLVPGAYPGLPPRRGEGSRTLSPARAALCVGLAALCTPLYPLTFWLHTDAMFMLVASLATWLALRWSSGRNGTWALAASLVLVAIGVSIRWAGMVYAAVVAGALLSRFDERRPMGLRLFASAGAFLVAGAAYIVLRLLLGTDGGGSLALATVGGIEEAQVPSLFVRERPDLPVIVEFLRRLTFLPSWISWTLWVPARFVAYSSPAGRVVDFLVGGLALVLVVMACVHQARRGRWVLPGAMVYVLGLCLAWPHVNNRYVVPVLPFVIAGVLSGLDVLRRGTAGRSSITQAVAPPAGRIQSPTRLAGEAATSEEVGGGATLPSDRSDAGAEAPDKLEHQEGSASLAYQAHPGLPPRRQERIESPTPTSPSPSDRSDRWRLGRGIFTLRAVSNGLRIAFIAALVLVNGAMWGVDVWVARSPTALDFYSRYEAGVHLSLIEVAAELSRRPDAVDGKVAVSERYENLRERWNYPTAQRVVAYVADITAEPVPRPLTGWGVRKLQQWARDNEMRYYVHQNPTVPGRIWHFRLSREQHGQIMGDLPGPHQPQFELYEMINHPTPEMPDRRWLELSVTPPLSEAELDRLGRRVPGVE